MLQTTNYKLQTQKGFTLIEAVVSTAVFAFVVSGILGVYVSILRLDTRIRAQNTLANDGRFIMDFFAKEIRNGRIDYDSYVNGKVCENSCINFAASTPTKLFLISQSGQPMYVHFWDRVNNIPMTSHNCSASNQVCDLRLTIGSGTTNLNSQNIRVKRFVAYVTPENDPYTIEGTTYPYNVQPHVTVILELETNFNPRDKVSVTLDSTFSTLYYPPRP